MDELRGQTAPIAGQQLVPMSQILKALDIAIVDIESKLGLLRPEKEEETLSTTILNDLQKYLQRMNTKLLRIATELEILK